MPRYAGDFEKRSRPKGDRARRRCVNARSALDLTGVFATVRASEVRPRRVDILGLSRWCFELRELVVRNLRLRCLE
jgi:hypothetical protein